MAPVVADAGNDGQRFRARLSDETVIGPDLLRIEVTAVLRRHAHTGQLTAAQARSAIGDLLAFPITVCPTAGLLQLVWELRPNLTAYDGCYVTHAEALDRPFVAADRRFGRAPGLRCQVEIL